MTDENSSPDNELRDTDAPPPADGLDELRHALAHCSNLCIDVLQRLDLGERRFKRIEEHQSYQDRRLDRLEQQAGLPPLAP